MRTIFHSSPTAAKWYRIRRSRSSKCSRVTMTAESTDCFRSSNTCSALSRSRRSPACRNSGSPKHLACSGANRAFATAYAAALSFRNDSRNCCGVVIEANDPATRRPGRMDCNGDALARLAAAGLFGFVYGSHTRSRAKAVPALSASSIELIPRPDRKHDEYKP